jgi:Uma2 family endonuclease
MSSLATPTQQYVILSDISWDTYQAMIRDMESDPGKRLTYEEGTLEIMSPLPIHERYRRLLGHIVEVTTEEMDVEMASFGSTTWSREDLRKGLESDECYYVQNELAVRGKVTIDLKADPPPDLAIEVDITSSSVNRMNIYAALAVPEVWRFDGESLQIYRLQQGSYEAQERSGVLPALRAEDVQGFLQTGLETGETRWIKHFRQWVKLNLQNSDLSESR